MQTINLQHRTMAICLINSAVEVMDMGLRRDETSHSRGGIMSGSSKGKLDITRILSQSKIDRFRRISILYHSRGSDESQDKYER
jgi:hypothetical protein